MNGLGNLQGLHISRGILGPWECEVCGQISQFADVTRGVNRIFCKNENCRYQRIIDKRRMVIKENDGTFWEFDNEGNKVRINGR